MHGDHGVRRWLTAAVLAALLPLVVVPGVAAAAPASVTIDDLEPKLEEADDGAWTAALGFTNLTDAPVTLSVAAVEPRTGCEPTLDKPSLPRAAHADVKLTLPAGCGADEDRVAVTVTSEPPGARFPVSAKAADGAKDPDWRHLLVFLVALALALAVAWRTFSTWTPPAPPAPTAPPAPSSTPGKPAWNGSLPHLDATYDVKESWVSNVTAIGAVLTGIFGSTEVIEAALGEDAKETLGLATVGAAIAVAFIAAGTVIPLALKARDAKSFTVAGILLGVSVTLAGAVGQLYLMTVTGLELDLGWAKWLLLPLALALLLLLLYAYARTALVATLNQGVSPPKDEPSEAIEAAELIVAALRGKIDIDASLVDEAVDDVRRRYPARGSSWGDEPFPRRRAVAL